MLNLQLVLLRSTIQSRTRQVAKLFHNLVKYGYGWYNYTKWAFTFKITTRLDALIPKHIRESSIYSPCINELSIVNGFIYNHLSWIYWIYLQFLVHLKPSEPGSDPFEARPWCCSATPRSIASKRLWAEQRQLTEEVCQAGFCRENVGDFGEQMGRYDENGNRFG